MAHRTTLLLDDETRAAARDLARQYGVTVSEAIRRSVIRQRDLAVGLPAERRAERRRALRRAIELFEGNDPAAEVRRLKAQDAGF
jgi:antitoxin component of RelBE/YafQ-DinJ toxin-antitoxin module